jgi:hypothetical protein
MLMLATFFLCRVSMFPMLYLCYTRSGLPTELLYTDSSLSPSPSSSSRGYTWLMVCSSWPPSFSAGCPCSPCSTSGTPGQAFPQTYLYTDSSLSPPPPSTSRGYTLLTVCSCWPPSFSAGCPCSPCSTSGTPGQAFPQTYIYTDSSLSLPLPLLAEATRC